MIGIIIVTHGDFGSYLLEACEHIVGRKDKIRSVSIYPKMTMDDIRKTIKKVTDEMRSECSSLVYLVDIPGGTPMNVVIPFAKEIKKSYVVCGLNMNMLIDAMILRERLDPDHFVDKIISDARRSICEVSEIFSSLNDKK
ncbi:MAG: PTS sugar transporter subunit IIA [Elusimicrobiales bacterium]